MTSVAQHSLSVSPAGWQACKDLLLLLEQRRPAGRSINKVCRHLASWVMWLQLSQENQCLHNRSEDCGGQPAALLGLHQIGRRGRQWGEERKERGGNVSQVERRRPRWKPVLVWWWSLLHQSYLVFFISSLCRREMQSALQEITVCLVRTRVIMVGLWSSYPAVQLPVPVVPLHFLCFNLVFTVYSKIGMTTATAR